MCGIVGYTGQNIAKSILLDGLFKLEYRGYDSAGFALMSHPQGLPSQGFVVQRSVGQVQNLFDASIELGHVETQGIAHTRWATHGAPSEVNAHPHRAGQLILVHNGIIENHDEIKQRLIQQGVTFSSQTDTEVFAQLVESHRLRLAGAQFAQLELAKRHEIVLESLRAAVGDVQGHYAALLMVIGLEGKLYGVQRGAPLALTSIADGTYVASDIQPLMKYSNNISFVPTDTIFSVSPEGFEYFEAATLKAREIKFEIIDWSADLVAKDGFEYFMLKEIHQQPMVVADTLSGKMPQGEGRNFLWDNQVEHEKLWQGTQKLYLVACGTAYYAAMTAKYYFEKLAQLSVEVDLASEFRYRSPVIEAGTVVGVISQSGETADTLSALRLAKERGAQTFAVCNVPGSTIAREAHFLYRTKAGPEIGVASTKAFTTQLTLLCALALDVARMRNQNGKESAEVLRALARLPHDMEAVLSASESMLNAGAGLEQKKTILFVGRGTMYPIALEGALKLKEITYRHAEGYAAGELKHGPIALVDSHLAAIVLAPSDELLPKTLSNLEEIRSRGGMIIGIGEAANGAFAKLCDQYIPMPKTASFVAPMLYVLPLQLMAYGLAKKLGCNIDKPRNLAKSVTVE